jgi:type II secretory pathway pseudopilin PulG
MESVDILFIKLYFDFHITNFIIISFLGYLVQQEMFEREVARLRNIYQQQQQQMQQQQQQTTGMHSRSSSRELDSQFASLSLKHKEPTANSGHETVSGPLRI